MYGDHYGISENHNKAMAKVLGKDEITEYDNAQLQRVPLFIHAPGVKGGRNHKFAGEVDVAPTVLHLLGVDTKDYLMSGSDILSKEHREVIPFRNGDFISPNYTKVSGKYYDTKTGRLLDDSEVDKKKTLSSRLSLKCLIRSSTAICFVSISRKALRKWILHNSIIRSVKIPQQMIKRINKSQIISMIWLFMFSSRRRP